MDDEKLDLLGLERYFSSKAINAKFNGLIWEVEMIPTRGEILRYKFKGEMNIISVPSPAPGIKQYQVYTNSGFGAQFDVPTSAEWQMRRIQTGEDLSLTCRLSPDREIRFT